MVNQKMLPRKRKIEGDDDLIEVPEECIEVLQRFQHYKG